MRYPLFNFNKGWCLSAFYGAHKLIFSIYLTHEHTHTHTKLKRVNCSVDYALVSTRNKQREKNDSHPFEKIQIQRFVHVQFVWFNRLRFIFSAMIFLIRFHLAHSPFSIAILIIQMFTLTMFTCVHSFNSATKNIWQPTHTQTTRNHVKVWWRETERERERGRKRTSERVWKNVGVPVKTFSKSICILIRCQRIKWMQLFDFWHHAEVHSAKSFKTQQILVVDWKLETTFLSHFVILLRRSECAIEQLYRFNAFRSFIFFSLTVSVLF